MGFQNGDDTSSPEIHEMIPGQKDLYVQFFTTPIWKVCGHFKSDIIQF